MSIPEDNTPQDGESFIARRMRLKKEREAAERLAAGTRSFDAPAVEVGTVATDNPRARKWLEVKREAEIASLYELLPDTNRNNTINNVAHSWGHYVPRWWSYEECHQALYDVGINIGLTSEELVGFTGNAGTLASGLRSGMREPRDPPVKVDGKPDDPFAEMLEASRTPDGPTITVDPETGEITVEPVRTSWWPRDIGPMVRGEADPEPPPTLLLRDDGQPLFYAGKINGLIGESESGKTWVALLAVRQALEQGHRVTYIDCEDSPTGIIARLRLLGATDAHLSMLAYVGPDDAFGGQAARDLFEHLAQHEPAVIVLDGYNAAMTMMGLNLLDNMDIYKFALALLRPLKLTGAAVIFVDHVTKSKEGRGNYAIGAQAKRADVDGCALNVEVVQPFGKGLVGQLRLSVSKDRPGFVRGASTSAKNTGTVTIDSSSDDRIVMGIAAPDLRSKQERGNFRPTVLMQRVSHFLANTAGAVSTVAVKKGVKGNEAGIGDALAVLVEEGYASRAAGARGVTYSHVRPFYDDTVESSTPFGD